MVSKLAENSPGLYCIFRLPHLVAGGSLRKRRGSTSRNCCDGASNCHFERPFIIYFLGNESIELSQNLGSTGVLQKEAIALFFVILYAVFGCGQCFWGSFTKMEFLRERLDRFKSNLVSVPPQVRYVDSGTYRRCL